MVTLYDSLFAFDRFGVFDVMIPFLLIFSIFYGILQKVKIFGDESKKTNVIIALSVGLISVFQHFQFRGSKYDVITTMNNALPQVALLLIAVVMLLVVVGLLGRSTKLGDSSATGFVIFIAIAYILYIFLSEAGLGMYRLPYWLSSSDTWAIVVAVLIFGLVLKFITAEDKPKDDKDSILKSLSGLFPKE
ncbi:MAG: hypothetical protein ACI8Y7_000774 [Candidatus Woesearchaeota archaeon]|jgi:hypothetical protein